MQCEPYLFFSGDCEEALGFYAPIFGGTDEGKRIFDALAAGGTIMEPWAKQFWGASFGMLTDRFGIDWMVNAGGS